MTSHVRIELTDELIERTLAGRAGSRAPGDLVEAIVSSAATTTQRRRSLVPALPGLARPRTAWLMVGAVLALLGLYRGRGCRLIPSPAADHARSGGAPRAVAIRRHACRAVDRLRG